MPELPEVETIVRGLRKNLVGQTLIDVWANAPKIIKKPTSFLDFKSCLKGKKIKAIKRAGKNIIFDLSGGYALLVHQKMTGHLLYGQWREQNGQWQAQKKGPLSDDKANGFLRLIFFLDTGFQFALSDLRKFAKVELWISEELKKSKYIQSLGQDALRISFERFQAVLAKKRGKIKTILMDQSVVAGIGNIYSDEILFLAKVHPLTPVHQIKKAKLKKIYQAMQNVLQKAVVLGGTSFSDYRTVFGQKGGYGEIRVVYRKKGQPCPKCQTPIKTMKIGSRTAHFCPKCQSFNH